jgi:hypothetical protein
MDVNETAYRVMLSIFTKSPDLTKKSNSLEIEAFEKLLIKWCIWNFPIVSIMCTISSPILIASIYQFSEA